MSRRRRSDSGAKKAPGGDPAPGLRDGTHVVEGEPRPLDRVLRELYPGVSWGAVRRAVSTGKVSVDEQVVREPQVPIQGGRQVQVRMAAPRSPDRARLAPDAIVHADSQLLVVRKPPGFDTVAQDDDPEDSLQQLAAEHLARRGQANKLIVVQRLDRDTSGLLVFARTVAAQEHLKEQFRRRTVTRRYLALAAGRVDRATFRSDLVYERDGHGHSVRPPRQGKPAVTHVEPVEALHGATLLGCRLETGRTHQIRIHLSEAGHPILGDSLYTSRRLSPPAAPRLMLHAARLGFTHPVGEQLIDIEEPPPEDMAEVIESLRG